MPTAWGDRREPQHHASTRDVGIRNRTPTYICLRPPAVESGLTAGVVGTLSSLAKRKHRRLTRGLAFSVSCTTTTVAYRFPRHTVRSNPLPLDITTGRCGFSTRWCLIKSWSSRAIAPRERLSTRRRTKNEPGNGGGDPGNMRSGIKVIAARASSTLTPIRPNMAGCGAALLDRIRS